MSRNCESSKYSTASFPPSAVATVPMRCADWFFRVSATLATFWLKLTLLVVVATFYVKRRRSTRRESRCLDAQRIEKRRLPKLEPSKPRYPGPHATFTNLSRDSLGAEVLKKWQNNPGPCASSTPSEERSRAPRVDYSASTTLFNAPSLHRKMYSRQQSNSLALRAGR